MKTKLILATILTAVLLIPSVSFAATLSTAQVNAIIGLLQAFGVDAATVQSVYADLVPPVVPVAQPAVVAAPTKDYSTYTPVPFELYQANLDAYLGKPIVIEGMVNALMPRGGNGGTTNYIQIINPFDQSQPKIQLEVDNASTYSSAAMSLQDKSSPIYQFVRAYGTGVPSQAFTMTSLLGSGTVMLPAVNITRIDKCQHGGMNTTVLMGSSFDENFSCSSWTTVGQ